MPVPIQSEFEIELNEKIIEFLNDNDMDLELAPTYTNLLIRLRSKILQLIRENPNKFKDEHEDMVFEPLESGDADEFVLFNIADCDFADRVYEHMEIRDRGQKLVDDDCFADLQQPLKNNLNCMLCTILYDFGTFEDVGHVSIEFINRQILDFFPNL